MLRTPLTISRRPPRLLLFALALLVVGCPLYPCQRSEDRYLRREVAEDEVVGFWRLTPMAAEHLEERGYSSPGAPIANTIEVRRDGTCNYRGPVLRPEIQHVSGECRWTLGKGDKQSIRFESRSGGSDYFYFDETRRGALLMWNHLDDPDLWRYIEFEKYGDL